MTTWRVIQKGEAMIRCTKPIQKRKQKIKRDKFGYCKVGRAIIKLGEKSNVAIARLENLTIQ